jgi:hypothetical protein
LPFLSPGQAQKEFTHNEALQTLDLATACAVQDGPVADPPSSPVAGECYIVGASPTGAWTGRPNAVAGYTSGGWRFIDPPEGMSVYVKASATSATFRQGEWEIGALRAASLIIGGEQVVGGRAAGIAAPAGGATVDGEARAAISSILAALRQHGLIES